MMRSSHGVDNISGEGNIADKNDAKFLALRISHGEPQNMLFPGEIQYRQMNADSSHGHIHEIIATH